MSILLMTQVRTIVISPIEQLILLYLADCGSDDGTRIFPSQTRIAYETGLNKRTVGGTLKRLEAKGILEPIAYARGGRGMATEYVMHLERGTPKPPYERGQKVAPDSTFRQKVAPDSTFRQKVAPDSTFRQKVAPDSTFRNENVESGSQNVESGSQNVESGSQNVAPDSTQPLLTIMEPLGEPLAAAPLASSLTETDFDRAGRLWDRIREQLLPSVPPGHQHWLKDVELVPDPRRDGWCLLVTGNYQRTLIEMRWANVIELKAANLSRRRLPVSVMSRDGYQRLWGIEADDVAPDGAVEREAVEA